MTNEIQAIIDEVASVLSVVSSMLPKNDIANAFDLLQHDEWGQAYMLVCTQLYEHDVPIDGELFTRLEQLGRQMRLPAVEWEMLRELITQS